MSRPVETGADLTGLAGPGKVFALGKNLDLRQMKEALLHQVGHPDVSGLQFALPPLGLNRMINRIRLKFRDPLFLSLHLLSQRIP